MNLDGRPYRGLRSDDLLIADLLSCQPPHVRHLVDQPWRLSSPDTQSGRFARVWPDSAGRLAGFAAWQTAWAALDLYVRDGPDRADLLDAIFSWADALFAELDVEQGRSLPYWLECRSDDRTTPELSASRGFSLTEDRYIGLEHRLGRLGKRPSLPPDFCIRSLAGEAAAVPYAELHQAAFGTTAMTGTWRSRTLEMPQYRSDLDLVAVTPDDRLAGFVVGWLDPARAIGQVEPLGVHPEFARMGMSAALLHEVLGRFRDLGASFAQVEAGQRNAAAIGVYQAAGFKPAHTIRAFGKLIDGVTAATAATG